MQLAGQELFVDNTDNAVRHRSAPTVGLAHRRPHPRCPRDSKLSSKSILCRCEGRRLHHSPPVWGLARVPEPLHDVPLDAVTPRIAEILTSIPPRLCQYHTSPRVLF
eukprot:138957-Prymnesium_polylepis.2